MKNLVLFVHTSLDGFVTGPNGEMDWINVDEEIFDYAAQRTNQADTALYGRVTYQMMESYWPQTANHLWQSTLFALLALGVVALIGRGPARARYIVWLIASYPDRRTGGAGDDLLECRQTTPDENTWLVTSLSFILSLRLLNSGMPSPNKIGFTNNQ